MFLDITRIQERTKVNNGEIARTSSALEGCGEGEDSAARHLPGEEDGGGDDAQAALGGQVQD